MWVKQTNFNAGESLGDDGDNDCADVRHDDDDNTDGDNLGGDDADGKLYRSISHNPTHVLRHYFIDKPKSGYSIRTRAYNFVLPSKDDKNFVSRSRPTSYATLKSTGLNYCDH